MASPLKGPISKTIGKALSGVMYALTLTRETEGYYEPGVGQVPGEILNFPCKGMIEDFDSMTLQRSSSFVEGSIIKPGDRKVTILSITLATAPKATDTITVDGTDYTIQSVTTDPAGATWSLVVR